MTTSHEVISAFVDDELFDASELAAALSDRDGRELLIDLIALRHVVEDVDHPPVVAATQQTQARRGLWLVGLAAALLLVASASYLAGSRVAHEGDAQLAATRSASSDAAPAPTRVITLTPGVNWHDSNGGY